MRIPHLNSLNSLNNFDYNITKICSRYLPIIVRRKNLGTDDSHQINQT